MGHSLTVGRPTGPWASCFASGTPGESPAAARKGLPHRILATFVGPRTLIFDCHSRLLKMKIGKTLRFKPQRLLAALVCSFLAAVANAQMTPSFGPMQFARTAGQWRHRLDVLESDAGSV